MLNTEPALKHSVFMWVFFVNVLSPPHSILCDWGGWGGGGGGGGEGGGRF